MVARLDRKCLGQKIFGKSGREHEAFSISRLEGSRWRGGRVELWGLNRSLVRIKDKWCCQGSARDL
jgi:hypothetical protein